jgi:hypothetical protein
VQLPAVGGGSQLASILVFTTIFNVDTSSATVAALVIWMITFASCSLVGVPLLIGEGFSLGKLRELGKEEKQEVAGVLPLGSTQHTMDELAPGPQASRGEYRE